MATAQRMRPTILLAYGPTPRGLHIFVARELFVKEPPRLANAVMLMKSAVQGWSLDVKLGA